MLLKYQARYYVRYSTFCTCQTYFGHIDQWVGQTPDPLPLLTLQVTDVLWQVVPVFLDLHHCQLSSTGVPALTLKYGLKGKAA